MPEPAGLGGWACWSPDGATLAWMASSAARFYDCRTNRPRGKLLSEFGTSDDTVLAVAADGHYRASKPVEDKIVYVVETDGGQTTLSPEQFAARYGWTNRPDAVHLVGNW